MCSSIERHAATIWTLTDALCEGSKNVEAVKGLKVSLVKLRQFVCQDWENDRAMNRLRGRLVDYINAKINPNGTIGINISLKNILAYCHMISALANDFFDQLPERPIDRGIAWRDLTTEIANLINLLDKPGSGSQAAKGCKWANDIMGILRGI